MVTAGDHVCKEASTVWSTGQLWHVHNFAECSAIFRILLLADSAVSLPLEFTTTERVHTLRCEIPGTVFD